MKKVSFVGISKKYWVIPAGAAALGFVAVAIGQTGTQKPNSAVTEFNSSSDLKQSQESPAPTAKPDISVNGTKVPTDVNGSRDVETSGGKAHVEVSNGHTRITTQESSSTGGASNQQSSNVDINIRSSSNGSSSSSNTTSIFSSGSNQDVNITTD